MRRKKKPKLDRLYYHGTDLEVHLGDRVVYRGLCGTSQGVVCHMPGESPQHPELEDDFSGLRHWAIKFPDGSMLSWLHAPDELQPSRRIKFVSRAEHGYAGIQPG